MVRLPVIMELDDIVGMEVVDMDLTMEDHPVDMAVVAATPVTMEVTLVDPAIVDLPPPHTLPLESRMNPKHLGLTVLSQINLKADPDIPQMKQRPIGAGNQEETVKLKKKHPSKVALFRETEDGKLQTAKMRSLMMGRVRRRSPKSKPPSLANVERRHHH